MCSTNCVNGVKKFLSLSERRNCDHEVRALHIPPPDICVSWSASCLCCVQAGAATDGRMSVPAGVSGERPATRAGVVPRWRAAMAGSGCARRHRSLGIRLNKAAAMAGRATEQVFPQPSPSAALCPVVVRPCMHSDSGLGEWPVPCDGTGRVVCEFLGVFWQLQRRPGPGCSGTVAVQRKAGLGRGFGIKPLALRVWSLCRRWFVGVVAR
jgi:hypothetical protein